MTAIERADDDLTRLRAQVRFLEHELADRDRLIAALKYNVAAKQEAIERLIARTFPVRGSVPLDNPEQAFDALLREIGITPQHPKGRVA